MTWSLDVDVDEDDDDARVPRFYFYRPSRRRKRRNGLLNRQTSDDASEKYSDSLVVALGEWLGVEYEWEYGSAQSVRILGACGRTNHT